MVLGLFQKGNAQGFLNPSGEDSSQSSLRGKPVVDLMPGRRSGLGYPLRYPNIVKGSVRAEINGRPLREGQDFNIDYSGGMIFVLTEIKPTDSLRVSYRYDPNAKVESNGSAMPMFNLNFGGNSSIKMLLGFSGAQRFADGTLVTSNNFGMQNSFGFKGGSMQGMFLMSSQAKSELQVDETSLDRTATKQGENAIDSLILQNFDIKTGDVKINASYQNVGTKFSGFGMLQGSGMDAKQANQLEKEKGLSRIGLGFSAGNENSLSFSNSYRSIDDGNAKIEFQNYGIKGNGFSAYYNLRSIDSNFSRFKDLAEGDRDQMMKERGITRTGMGGSLGFFNSTLKFDQNMIEDPSGSIERNGFSFNSPWMIASYNTQNISAGFNRINDLAEGERGQWIRERGMNRTDFNFAIPNKDKAPFLSFGSKSIEHTDKDFSNSFGALNYGGLTAEFWNRSIEAGFNRLGDLSQGELDSMILQNIRAYDANAQLNGNDRGFIVRESGIDRSFARLGYQFGKDYKVDWNQYEIGAGDDRIERQNFSISGPKGFLSYRHQEIDPEFGRIGDLMERERQLYSGQQGFGRTELSGKYNINPKSSLDFSTLQIDSLQGGLQRTSLSYVSPGLELRAGMREVDDEFVRAGEVNDPEKELFRELIGYSEYDLYMKVDLIKNFKLQASFLNAENGDPDDKKYRNSVNLLYSPTGKSLLSLNLFSNQYNSVNGALYNNELMASEYSQDFGKSGKINVRHETEEFGDNQSFHPDRETNAFRYETKLNGSTSISTEQIRTEFSNGGYENVQAYKLAWQVNKKLNLSTTYWAVDRDPTKNDQSTQDFGITYDFGNNFKLGYTYFRDLNTAGGGKRNYNWTLTPGSIGGINVSGSYDDKRLDGIKTTSLGRFSISNPKPFQLGFMKDVTFRFGYEGLKDSGLYQKENQIADFATNIFGSQFGLSYGEVLMPGQKYGVDKTVRFSLDPTGKKNLQLNAKYKMRSLPNNVEQIIRDYDFSYKMGNFQIVHSYDSLPEQKQDGNLLGSIALPTSTRNWALNWTPGKFASTEFNFQEVMRFDQKTLSRRASATVSLFNDSGSPVRLTYGLEQNAIRENRKTRAVYEVAFDQKPGPNQTFSLVIGTVNWYDGRDANEPWHSMRFRLDYQLKF